MDPQPSPQASLHTPLLTYRRAEVLADATDNCYRCGYPLLGIDDEQACPECGLLARRSRRTTDELHNSRPRWLARISRGANLILFAILIAAASPFAKPLLFELLYRAIGFGPLWYVLPWAGLTLAAMLAVVGVWLLTGPEGYPPADRADGRLRLWLRLAACVPMVGIGFGVCREFIGAGVVSPAVTAGMREVLEWAIWGSFTVGLVPLPLLLFLHLRGLAKRARSAHLAEHCVIVGLGTAATVLLFTAFAVVLGNAEELGLRDDWVSRSDVSLGTMVALVVMGILFLLWSLYLFIRFALAFRRAARELNARWTADDRTLA